MIIPALCIIGAGLVGLALILFARRLEAKFWRRSLVAIELCFPLGLSAHDLANWLNTAAAALYPSSHSLLFGPALGLEVVADRTGVRHILLMPRSIRESVLAGLRAALPGVRIEEAADYLTTRPRCTAGVEAAMTSQQRQLAVERAENVATAVLATLQPLQADEIIVVQWLLTGAGTPAPVASAAHHHDLPRWITGEELMDGEAIRSARTKQTDALFLGSLRIGAAADSTARASTLLKRVFDQHRGQNAPGVTLVPRSWMSRSWAADRVSRLTIPLTTLPLRLSTREAAGLLPIPLGEVALPGVQVGIARQLPPPPTMTAHGVHIGASNYPDLPTPLWLSDVDRLQHLHVLGPTGTGKSTLLARLIEQDIAAGHGVIVLDPKRDLVETILARMPEHRAGDIIVLDPAATDRPIGFNILQSGHDEQSRELVVDHVIHIWHEIYKDFWGPRSEDVLRGALLSLINTRASNGELFTLIETPELLTSSDLRKFVTAQDGVPAGLDTFWQWYRGIDTNERLRIIGPILNKLRAATLRTPIRLMLGQSEGIDLDQVINERKVLLVPLSAGTLGQETANLLGTILLAGIWFAIQRRVVIPQDQRHPIFVYIDECQNVLKLPVDLADMLSMARGLGASFTLAHQYLGQIEDRQVKSALLGTVRSQLLFSCQREDAAALAPSYAPYLTADDLMGAARYEFAARLLVAGQTLAPLTGTALSLEPASGTCEPVAERSRQSYGTPRAQVEQSLTARRVSPDTGDARMPDSPRSRPASFGRRRKPAGGEKATA